MTQQDLANRDEASAVAARIEELLDSFGQADDPGVRARAEELVRAIVGFYGEGLSRVVRILHEFSEETGAELHQELAADALVGSLLALHELHPRRTEDRVAAALERVRLGSHTGGVDFLGIDEDFVVRLRLRGNSDGCPSSTVTVKHAIEEAIRGAAPEVAEIVVEGTDDSTPGPGDRRLLPLVPAESGAQR